MSNKRKVVIIGSGPAGYTAGIYTGRAQLQPLLLAGEKSGGQLMWTTEVENFPGFPGGVQGPELMISMREQANKFGAEIKDTYVTAVDFSLRPFKIWTRQPEGSTSLDLIEKADARDAGQKVAEIKKHPHDFEADTIIITTGAKAKMLGIPGEMDLLGRGVATCAVCDAAFYRDKITFVAGGGDAAVEEAMALTKFAKSVTLLVRSDQMRASKIMIDRVMNHPKIEVKLNTQATQINGSQKVESIVLLNQKTGSEEEVKADGFFVSIGHVPVTEIFKGQLELDPHGYIRTHQNSSQKEIAEEIWLHDYPTMTSVEGVFAAGDVVDFRYRQAITSAGFGCMAALDVEKFLTGHTASY